MKQEKELDRLKDELADLAIQIAGSFRIKLDYTEKSIRKVEKVLSKIHKEYRKTKNEDGLQGIAAEFAFYIIKTIEKNHESGKLERDHPDFGENSFPYYWKDTTLLPYGWCLKRIFEGKQDNVWSKYKTLVMKK